MGFFFQGLTLGLAYVAPIGMQNLFVIDSALTKPRRRALLTALIVLFFDVSLSLSCFFGIGRLMQDYAWLKLAILAIGGLVVIRIGAGLLFPGKVAMMAPRKRRSRGPRNRRALRNASLRNSAATASCCTPSSPPVW